MSFDSRADCPAELVGATDQPLELTGDRTTVQFRRKFTREFRAEAVDDRCCWGNPGCYYGA